MMKCALKMLVITACIASPLTAFSAAPVFNPIDFGAAADGKTIDTAAIQKAIDEASQQGGGTVVLKAGTYLSGPIELKSHVTLQLDKGSILKAAADPTLFKAAFINDDAQSGEAFILANHVQQIGITGEGKIDGSGEIWWKQAQEVRDHVRSGDIAYFTSRFPHIPVANGMPRPWLIELNSVKHAEIGNVHVTQSPMWNVVIRNSQFIHIDGLQVTNPSNSPNTDGIDIVSSSDITMKHLDISTGDDNIAIKSGLAGATLFTRPSSKITISDSVFREGHGVSVGSETAHGINNIDIHDVKFIGTENGIRIKSARDRGADIFHIYANNITMDGVNTPITITDSYSGQSGSDKGNSTLPVIAPAAQTLTTPFIHDVHITHLTATNAQTAGVLYGLPEALLKNIVLSHVQIDAKTNGLLMAYVQGRIDNTVIQGTNTEPFNRGPKTFMLINGKNH